jgi:hypothetical protein
MERAVQLLSKTKAWDRSVVASIVGPFMGAVLAPIGRKLSSLTLGACSACRR